MRTILIRQKHTQDHKAALEAIHKMGWMEGDCEIIPCNNYRILFLRLCEPSQSTYAVVPIHSSISGKVKEIATCMERMGGSDFEKVAELKLLINHCIFALPNTHVGYANQLKFVITDERTSLECSHFIQRNQIDPKVRGTLEDRDPAGVVVSLGDPLFGTIGVKELAGAYKLKLLHENIQNGGVGATTEFCVLFRKKPRKR